MESMEEIYQNHSKKVYTFLLSKTCNHELAEELTQETFFWSKLILQENPNPLPHPVPAV